MAEVRALRRMERDKNEIESKEIKDICGAKVVKKIERIVKQMTEDTPYEDLSDAYRLMM